MFLSRLRDRLEGKGKRELFGSSRTPFLSSHSYLLRSLLQITDSRRTRGQRDHARRRTRSHLLLSSSRHDNQMHRRSRIRLYRSRYEIDHPRSGARRLERISLWRFRFERENAGRREASRQVFPIWRARFRNCRDGRREEIGRSHFQAD